MSVYPQIEQNQLSVAFTPAGVVRSIALDDLQVSQYRPSEHDNGTSGLWLRRFNRRTGALDSARLVGAVDPAVHFELGEGSARWSGQALGVRWAAKLSISAAGTADFDSAGSKANDDELTDLSSCYWQVTIDSVADTTTGQSDPDELWELIAAQDLALAPSGQALSSEPYISQYIAYHVEDDPQRGTVLAARQTMANAPALPLLVASFLGGDQGQADGFLTDGFDFYGLGARAGQEPQALGQQDWSDNHIDQYEFGLAVLKSAARPLGEGGLSWTLVYAFTPDYQGELAAACRAGLTVGSSALGSGVLDSQLDFKQSSLVSTDLAGEQSVVSSADSISKVTSLLATAPLLNGRLLSQAELTELGGGAINDPEIAPGGSLLSYFTGRQAHVVAAAKELQVARSHGQILLADAHFDLSAPVMAATTFMPGVFASHIVLGNTNLNRLVSVHRTSFNLLRSQGVRILVNLADEGGANGRLVGKNGAWQLLGLPSAYLMELGGSRWVYQLTDRTITVRTTAAADSPVIALSVTASRPTSFIVTFDVEDTSNWAWSDNDSHDCVTIQPVAGSFTQQHCPDLAYAFYTSQGSFSGDAPVFGGQPQDSNVFTLVTDRLSQLDFGVTASMDGAEVAQAAAQVLARQPLDSDQELAAQYRAVCSLGRGLTISHDAKLDEFNRALPWLIHDGLVHFLSPHGLEQYSGAAWGTRDVFQGPFELALAFGQFDTAATILRRVLAHQNTDGSLPQWFMFDQYAQLYQKDAHGDVPVWPLIAAEEYLRVTGDWSILEQTVPFWDKDRDCPVELTASCADHLNRVYQYIEAHRVPGTDLFSYGEGDWDDTLQPAQASLKRQMASTWTIALLYQASDGLAAVLTESVQTLPVDRAQAELLARARQEAEAIRSEFADQFIVNGVLAGYMNFAPTGPQPIIHPQDSVTGIHYRLIPMTRSIIAGLVSPEQALVNEQIVEDHLHYPDGVRLMDRPAAFHDGKTKFFKRGEQAASVGREIGLMYTHAHIRYTEALAALGRSSVADELLRVSPVDEFKRLPTSEPHQRNCYFSSSDADFADRYQAAAHWGDLSSDSAHPVGVRGGWRVYSSGPGIFLRQLVQHVLGLEIRQDCLVLDPLLDPADDGLTAEVELFGKRRTITYHVVSGPGLSLTLGLSDRPLNLSQLQLPYRAGGLILDRTTLGEADQIDCTVGASRGL